MICHLVDQDLTSLELKGDGTFRWLTQGCDFAGREVGRWIDESGSIVLLPRTGRDRFRWPQSLTERASVVLRRNGPRLDTDLGTDGDTNAQSWDPGGRCAMCSGAVLPPGTFQLGPSGAYDCDDPFMGAWIDPPDNQR